MQRPLCAQPVTVTPSWCPPSRSLTYFAYAWPTLRDVLANNFVRGAISGLGIVNLFAGFADLALVFSTRGRSDVSLTEPSGRP